MLYFAYGSNLNSKRMRSRVPSAGVVCTARLTGYRLAFRKRGHDGSVKCDLESAEGGTVWGVVYRLDPAELDDLDAAEGEGYERLEQPVTSADGESRFDVVTYRARAEWIEEGLPFDWYLDHVVSGAKEHGLPPPYAAALEAMDTVSDPQGERHD